MRRYLTRYCLCLFLLPGLWFSALGQEESILDKPHQHWNFYLLKSAKASDHGSSGWSKIGAGLLYEISPKDDFSVFWDISYRQWDNFGEKILPVYLGILYRISVSPSSNLTIGPGAGPHLVIGNDYGTIAAAATIQTNIDMPVGTRIKIFAGLNHSFAWLFHPAQYNYWDFKLGLKF